MTEQIKLVAWCDQEWSLTDLPYAEEVILIKQDVHRQSGIKEELVWEKLEGVGDYHYFGMKMSDVHNHFEGNEIEAKGFMELSDMIMRGIIDSGEQWDYQLEFPYRGKRYAVVLDWYCQE